MGKERIYRVGDGEHPFPFFDFLTRYEYVGDCLSGHRKTGFHFFDLAFVSELKTKPGFFLCLGQEGSQQKNQCHDLFFHRFYF